MKRIFRITIAWLLAVLVFPAVPVSAVQTVGIHITAPAAPVTPGSEFTVTVALADYTAEDPIRGLQVDVEGLDPALVDLEQVRAESLLSAEAPRNNITSVQKANQMVKLLYVSAEGETLDASESELLRITLRLNETLTGSGTITLHTTTLIHTESGPQPSVRQSVEIAYAQPAASAAAAIIGVDGSETQYPTFQEALDEVQSGERVILLKNVETRIAMVKEDVTLDLNGYALTANYVSCFGNIIDGNADNAGVLCVSKKQFMIRKDNLQLPIWTGEGYRFVEVRSFNQAVPEDGKYVFQPLFETDAHQLLLSGMQGDVNETGVTVNVRVSWKTKDGIRTQNFVYNTDHIAKYITSYKDTEGKYGQMFALTLRGTEDLENLTVSACIESSAGVEFSSEMLHFVTE